MKKLIALLILLSCFSISGAQQLPEFSLHVKLFINNDSARTVIFGYDPAASDSMIYRREAWFSDEFGGGEQLYPPGQTGDLDFRMSGFYVGRPELGIDASDGGPIDIRNKPVRDTFSLKYGIECNVVHGTTNARLVWDPQLIPPIIKHITLASYKFPSKIRLDMKSTSSFVIPLIDSGEDLYSNMILTLYYNRELDAPQSSVLSAVQNDLLLYPNPMDSKSKLHFTMHEDTRVNVSVYDVNGKRIYDRFFNTEKRDNSIDLNKSDFTSHSGVYLLRIKGDGFERSSTLIVR